MQLAATRWGRAWFGLVVLVLVVRSAGLLDAVEKKTAALLFVSDALTSPNQPTTIEAKLLAKGLLASTALGGELLELVIEDQVAATAMTGGDGKAFFTYTPKTRGVTPVHVRLGNSPRVEPTEGQATLAVWETRQPILVVEVASLIEERTPSRVPSVGIGIVAERKPMPDAADELGKLTQFYYKLIYVVHSPGGDGFQASVAARDWLKTHKFPMGFVLALPSDPKALGTKIDEFHAGGWKTVKVGVGRSKAFAEAFLQRRLDVVIVPEPTKGDVPRKAKVAKEWKEVRKKL